MIFHSKNFIDKKKGYHAFFSRKNGTSNGIYKSLNCGLGSKDNKNNVYKNLAIIKKKAKTKFLFLVRQEHTNKIIELKKIPLSIKQPRIGTADGIFTKLNNVAIGILTADCAPILITDKNNNYICCVHAGWKGAFADIIKNAVKLFKKNKINTTNLKVCIGPCISEKNYEVKIDFYHKFLKKNKKNHNYFIFKKHKIYFNLRKFIVSKLLELNISQKNITNINFDTFSNPSLFYSYRRSTLRSEKDYGRNLSLIIKYN